MGTNQPRLHPAAVGGGVGGSNFGSVLHRGTESQRRGELAKPCDHRGQEKSSNEEGEGHSNLSLPLLRGLLGGTLCPPPT